MPEAQLRSTAGCLLMVDVCPSEDHDKLFPKLGCDVLPSSVTLLNCSETSFPLTAENHFCRLVKVPGFLVFNNASLIHSDGLRLGDDP